MDVAFTENLVLTCFIYGYNPGDTIVKPINSMQTATFTNLIDLIRDFFSAADSVESTSVLFSVLSFSLEFSVLAMVCITFCFHYFSPNDVFDHLRYLKFCFQSSSKETRN